MKHLTLFNTFRNLTRTREWAARLEQFSPTFRSRRRIAIAPLHFCPHPSKWAHTIFVLSLCSLIGCSRIASVPRYTEELQTSIDSMQEQERPSGWDILDQGEFQVLKKKFTDNKNVSFDVHSVGIESCGLRQTSARQAALARQLFSGFQRVELSAAATRKWVPQGMSLIRVTASLDGKSIRSLIFSQFFDECLIEQAFWIKSEAPWLHNEQIEKLLFTALQDLPPWNKHGKDSAAPDSGGANP